MRKSHSTFGDEMILFWMKNDVWNLNAQMYTWYLAGNFVSNSVLFINFGSLGYRGLPFKSSLRRTPNSRNGNCSWVFTTWFWNAPMKQNQIFANYSLTLNMLTSSGNWALLRSKIVVGRRCFNVNLDRRAWKSRPDGQKGRKRKMAVLCRKPTDFWPLCRCDFGTSVINAIN